MIKLSKQQISAIAEEIESNLKLQKEEAVSKIEKSAEFKKLQDEAVKKYSDILKFLKDHPDAEIRYQKITDKYTPVDYEEFLEAVKEKSVKHLYDFKMPTNHQIERQVVLNTIDTTSVEELIGKISSKYEICFKKS
jgi:hypothetical protein